MRLSYDAKQHLFILILVASAGLLIRLGRHLKWMMLKMKTAMVVQSVTKLEKDNLHVQVCAFYLQFKMDILRKLKENS